MEVGGEWMVGGVDGYRRNGGMHTGIAGWRYRVVASEIGEWLNRMASNSSWGGLGCDAQGVPVRSVYSNNRLVVDLYI